MNCRAEIEIESNALERLMALLFALADLADLAASRSWPVRLLALSILGRAEQVAHAFVTGWAGTANLELPPPASAAPAPRRDGPVDAMRLALSLRMLALAVCAMLAEIRHRSRGRPGRDADHGVACAPTGLTLPLSDSFPQARQAAALSGLAFRKWPDTS